MPHTNEGAVPQDGPNTPNTKELIGMERNATCRGAQVNPPSDDALRGWAMAHHQSATCPRCTPRWSLDGRSPQALDWEKQLHNVWLGITHPNKHLLATGLQFLRWQILEHGGEIDDLPLNSAYRAAPYVSQPYNLHLDWCRSITVKRPLKLTIAPSGARSLHAEVTITTGYLQRTGAVNLADASSRAAFARTLPEDLREELAAALQDVYVELLQETDEPVEANFDVLDLGQMLERPTPGWLIDGILPEGALCQIFGPSGSGKSFVSLDMAASIAYFEPWLGRRVRGGLDVLYVVAEGASWFAKRVEAWGEGRRLNPSFMRLAGTLHFVAAQTEFANPEVVDRLLRAIRTRDIAPAVVFVDTLSATLAGRDENSAVGVQPYLDGIKGLQAETGATIVLVHHTGHAEQDRSRGWSGLYAALDVEIRVSALAPNNGLLESLIESTKSKDGQPFDKMTICLMPVGASLVPELVEGDRTGGGERPLTTKAEAVLQLLVDAGGEVVQTTALRAGLGGASRESVARWGSELAARGLAEQVIDGNASGWRACVTGVTYDASVTHDAPAANRHPSVTASHNPFRGVTPDAGGSGRDAADVEIEEKKEEPDAEPEDITPPPAGEPRRPRPPRIIEIPGLPPTTSKPPRRSSKGRN